MKRLRRNWLKQKQPNKKISSYTTLMGIRHVEAKIFNRMKMLDMDVFNTLLSPTGRGCFIVGVKCSK
uniref:Uncharacterized protein n=1 Tax=Parascaris univalens TaxID=6257 RepID=A0A915AE81_PARUN